MKKSKRKFIHFIMSISLVPLVSFISFFKDQKRYKKKLFLKKKFSKIWLLDINDS